MGSFAGHIDEAIFFLAIAVWWMCNAFPRYIRSQWTRIEFENVMSYGWPWRPIIPVESIFKILFPVCGFMAEVIRGGAYFFDEAGNFRKVNGLQHMSIYGLFILHGIIDLIYHVGVPLPKGLDFLSGSLCFTWYGISFGYHANMHGKEGVEKMVHTLPINTMLLCGLVLLIELWRRNSFMAHVVRIYCLLVLGTWFVHVSHILYLPTPFPGELENPNWDRTDMDNVYALVAIFGYHLCLHIVTIVTFYLGILFWLRAKGEHTRKFSPLLNEEDNMEM